MEGVVRFGVKAARAWRQGDGARGRMMDLTNREPELKKIREE
jgi:hypothetical protein